MIENKIIICRCYDQLIRKKKSIIYRLTNSNNKNSKERLLLDIQIREFFYYKIYFNYGIGCSLREQCKCKRSSGLSPEAFKHLEVENIIQNPKESLKTSSQKVR